MRKRSRGLEMVDVKEPSGDTLEKALRRAVRGTRTYISIEG